MVHDFSEQKKSELRGQLQEVENDGQNIIADTVGDIISTFSSWIGVLSIENYLGSVSEYHRKIIDQRDMKMHELLEIFDHVESVDRQYQSEIAWLIDALEEYKNSIGKLASLMSMDKKYFNVANVGRVGFTITGSIANGELWTNSVFDRQLDKAEARVLKETAKDLISDVLLVAGSVIGFVVNIKTADSVGAAADLWQTIDGVCCTFQDVSALVLIGTGKISEFTNKEGCNRVRLMRLKEAEQYQEADGMEEQFRMAGWDFVADTVSGSNMIFDVIGLVDSAKDIVESAGKFEKILTDGGVDKQARVEEMLLGEVGLKKTQIPYCKEKDGILRKTKESKNIVSNIKTLYTYATGALEGNIGEKIFGKTGVGGFASDVQEFTSDFGEYWMDDLGMPDLADIVCMLN